MFIFTLKQCSWVQVSVVPLEVMICLIIISLNFPQKKKKGETTSIDPIGQITKIPSSQAGLLLIAGDSGFLSGQKMYNNNQSIPRPL